MISALVLKNLKCVSPLTTNATPEGFPRRGGQGLSAAKAIRYAANTPPAKDKTPRPVEDLEDKMRQIIKLYISHNDHM